MTKQSRDARQINSDMQKARALIKAKKYEQARQILITVNHPKARQWLEHINKIDLPKSSTSQKRSSWGRLLIYSLIAVVIFSVTILSLVFLFSPSEELIITRTAIADLLTKSHETESVIATNANATEGVLTEVMADIQTATASAQPTATPTNTLIPEGDVQSTSSAMQQSLSTFQGIEAIYSLDMTYNYSGEPSVYAEIRVARNADKTELADDLLSYSFYLLGNSNYADFSMILDDGTTAVSYTLDIDSGDWVITTMDAFNTNRAETEAARPTNTPRPTRRPTQPSSSSSSSSSNQTQWNCSGNRYNCDDFSSCSAISSYWNSCPGDPSMLDGDNDGIPCESRCR